MIDATDQNGAGAGDNPELLGLITLTGIPSGVELHYGASSYTSTGAAITIELSDAGNLISAPGTATLTMTTAEFEAIQVLPVAQDADDFTVTMSVTEYEVDDSWYSNYRSDRSDIYDNSSSRCLSCYGPCFSSDQCCRFL